MSYPIPPREFPFQSPTGAVFDYCDGPEVEEEPGTKRWTTRWCAWVAADGVRYGRVDVGDTRTDDGGELCALFDPGAAPTHLSFCFDQDGRPVMAVQHDATTAEVRKFVLGSPASFEFAGLNPIVFYNGVLLHDTPICDVVVLYLKAAGDTIYARIQRNDFDTEYELNLELKTTLQRLCKVDAIQALGQWWLAIYAIDTKHRPCVYSSEAYPPWPAEVETRDQTSVSIDEIILDNAILFCWPPNEQGRETISLADLVYDESILNLWLPNEHGQEAISLEDLVYLSALIYCSPPAEKGSQNVSIEEAIHLVIVVSGGTLIEKGTQSVGIEEIIYS